MIARATLALLLGFVLGLAFVRLAPARDNGQYTNSPLKPWMDRLASGKGLCCSFADGVSIKDLDWDTDGGHYRVRFCRSGPWTADCNIDWLVVPTDAVVTEPNRLGSAVLWPFVDADGITQIRCFMPGGGF
jgi:hypothetical protein